jgi:hypothetical protein
MSAKLCSLIPDNYARALKKDNLFGEENREKAIGVSKREQSQFGEPNTSCNANLFFGFFFDNTKNNYRLAAKSE